MDWQIRIALLITGIFVIGFIVYDYNRRKKAQADKQRLIDQVRRSAEQVDSAGFDFTGVGSARPVSEASEQEPEQRPEQQIAQAQNEPQETARELEGAVPVKAENQQSVSSSNSSKTSPTEQLTLDEAQPSQAPELVISLILQAEEGSSYKGRDFMPLVLSQGLRHGEMGIFHRHTGTGGKPGPVMYSVANAIKPGTFDLTNIEVFETPAFAFFMIIPGPGEPVAAFEGMVKTIKLFQSELGGQILDDSKSVYTEQRYQHQLDTIREYMTKAGLHTS